jgi:hypothetical protein
VEPKSANAGSGKGCQMSLVTILNRPCVILVSRDARHHLFVFGNPSRVAAAGRSSDDFRTNESEREREREREEWMESRNGSGGGGGGGGGGGYLSATPCCSRSVVVVERVSFLKTSACKTIPFVWLQVHFPSIRSTMKRPRSYGM